MKKTNKIYFKKWNEKTQKYSLEKPVQVPTGKVASWILQNKEYLFIRWERK